MRIRTAKDMGATIKQRRRSLGLDQAELAKAAGVSRLWINQVEAGKAGASLGLILRTLAALGIELSVITTSSGSKPRAIQSPDINAIVAGARRWPKA